MSVESNMYKKKDQVVNTLEVLAEAMPLFVASKPNVPVAQDIKSKNGIFGQQDLNVFTRRRYDAALELAYRAIESRTMQNLNLAEQILGQLIFFDVPYDERAGFFWYLQASLLCTKYWLVRQDTKNPPPQVVSASDVYSDALRAMNFGCVRAALSSGDQLQHPVFPPLTRENAYEQRRVYASGMRRILQSVEKLLPTAFLADEKGGDVRTQEQTRGIMWTAMNYLTEKADVIPLETIATVLPHDAKALCPSVCYGRVPLRKQTVASSSSSSAVVNTEIYVAAKNCKVYYSFAMEPLEWKQLQVMAPWQDVEWKHVRGTDPWLLLDSTKGSYVGQMVSRDTHPELGLHGSDPYLFLTQVRFFVEDKDKHPASPLFPMPRQISTAPLWIESVHPLILSTLHAGKTSKSKTGESEMDFFFPKIEMLGAHRVMDVHPHVVADPVWLGSEFGVALLVCIATSSRSVGLGLGKVQHSSCPAYVQPPSSDSVLASSSSSSSSSASSISTSGNSSPQEPEPRSNVFIWWRMRSVQLCGSSSQQQWRLAEHTRPFVFSSKAKTGITVFYHILGIEQGDTLDGKNAQLVLQDGVDPAHVCWRVPIFKTPLQQLVQSCSKSQ